jgi:hypothetical protein
MFGLIIFYGVLYFLTKWSRPEFKAVSAMISVGYGLIVLGTGLFSQIIPFFLEPVLIMVGTIFFLLPTIISPDILSQKKYYWYIAFAFLETEVVVACIITIFYYSIEQVMFTLGFTIGLSIIVYLIIKDVIVKPETVALEEEKAESNKDILGMFTKPKALTEEEVSVSKEKKICLVCKGNIAGINFVCFECGTLYCNKCYNALINLENACWACDNALDESTPVKLSKEKEPEMIIQEDIPKK